jgi:lipopolysaccharide/colanic/teichoic acid biosynthesis glycosyltransferase
MSKVAKHTLDLTGAIVGLTMLFVPFVIIAIAIKIESRGPVFFRVPRVGLHGREFTPWKFRTMTHRPTRSLEDVSETTRIGRLLRLTSIDELPQLMNVLTGQMSLVGPRPAWPYQVQQYSPFHLGRLRVKPGVTGLAAIRGRNEISWPARIEIDNRYIDTWSLCQDLKILLLTPWKVVTLSGIYGPGGKNEDL